MLLTYVPEDTDPGDQWADTAQASMMARTQHVRSRRQEYVDLLTKTAEVRAADEAVQLLFNMRAQKVPVDTTTYNAVMAACLDEPLRFGQLRNDMRMEKVPPNFATLAITTTLCESNGLFEEAFLQQVDILRSASRRAVALRCFVPVRLMVLTAAAAAAVGRLYCSRTFRCHYQTRHCRPP
jgi:hypothetical protein